MTGAAETARRHRAKRTRAVIPDSAHLDVPPRLVLRSADEKLARWVKRQGGNWTIIMTFGSRSKGTQSLARGRVDRINAGLKTWDSVGQFRASYRSTPNGYVVLAKWVGDWPEGDSPVPNTFNAERVKSDDEEGLDPVVLLSAILDEDGGEPPVIVHVEGAGDGEAN